MAISNLSELDEYDQKILKTLQTNADLSMTEIGDIVGLSHTPCWRRIKKLEQEGFIRGRVTLLDQDRMQLGVTVHAYITIKRHDETSLEDFENAVQDVKKIALIQI